MREEILNELREVIPIITSFYLRFGNRDIRASFLDGYFQILRTYFCAYYHLESNDILVKYRAIYPESENTFESIGLHLQGHKNLLNSFLILNSWSTFELCITLMANSILEDSTKEGLLLLDYSRIRKILKTINITDVINERLRRFRRYHLAHVPIINKYGNLFKRLVGYPQNRNKRTDREFLEFYGKLRNCVHSNYIYYGRNQFNYSYRGVNFRFIHGELVHQEPIRENTIFLLNLNLKNIFLAIAENINYRKEIPDPSHDLLN